MKQVYALDSNRTAVPVERVRCADETVELQNLLAANPDLLAGDQMTPESPRRWLTVKREMPVPDPVSAGNRWSVDFLFVDQDAVLTFVECKRFEDTRARREVIGQVMEYAANGQFYWDREWLLSAAEHEAEARGETLSEALSKLLLDEQLNADFFFQKAEENLKAGILRIVFFLEEAPIELKSIVEFLNNQMERTEVLVVEAEQFDVNGMRLITPSLYGYSEQARKVKHTAATEASQRRRSWNRASTLDHLTATGSPSSDAFKRVIAFIDAHRDVIKDDYGTGQSPSLIVKDSNSTTLVLIYGDGTVQLALQQIDKRRDPASIRKVVENRRILQWTQDLESAKYPSLTKKLHALSDEEMDAFEHLLLEIVQTEQMIE